MTEQGSNAQNDKKKKFIKILFNFYAGMEYLLEKINGSYNCPKNALTSKLSKLTACDYSIFTQCSFFSSKNKHDYGRGQDCKKKFCGDLRKHATEIIYYKKKEVYH